MLGYHSRPSLWEQFTDVQGLLDDLSRVAARPMSLLHEAPDYPAVNVWSNADSLAVTAELPGIDQDSLQISVVDDTLTISGQRPDDTPDGAKLLRRERVARSFTRSLRLPYPVDSDQAEARYRNGILCVVLPRNEADKPRRIEVKD